MPVKKTTVKKTVKKARKPGKPKPKKTTQLPAKLVKYLDEAGIDHQILEHKTVYTALDAAATMKKKMNEIAKALYVKADRDYFVVVLPADQNLDFPKLAKCLSASSEKSYIAVKIPGEKIMLNALKLKAGAMTAFGKLHQLPAVVEKNLTKVKKAVFASGSFNHSVEMAVKDFIDLEEAVVGSFGKKKKVKKS
jgi:Ala-tRNA(Pro) deacylase